MPARKYKTDPFRLLAEGQKIVVSSNDPRFKHKVEMVNLVLSGLTPSYLSKYCAESKSTITLWVKIADEQGFDALRPKPRPGRPPKLTLEQLEEVRKTLENDEPQKHGFHVWDVLSLSAYVKKAYNVDIGVRQCQRLFHSLGFSLVRPRIFPSKGKENTEERVAYKKNP